MHETRNKKFRALNIYVKIVNKVSIAVGIIACIPFLMSIYWAFQVLWYVGIADIKYELSRLLPSLIPLGISFGLFYIAAMLLIISELIQCFLAIEENTYLSANTSSNQPPSSNQPTD